MVHRLRRSRRWLAALAALALAVGLAACSSSSGSGSDSGTDSSDGGSHTLVQAVATDANGLDPAKCLTSSCHELAFNTYERLVTFKYKPSSNGSQIYDALEVTPQLASSWKQDGATVTFTLRDDVKFYPSGNPLTADDVVYSFARLTSLPGTNGNFQAAVAGLYNPSQTVAVDPHTVAITYTNRSGAPTVSPVSLPNMRFTQFAIIDSVEAKKHATDTDPWSTDWLKDNAVGSGTYYVASRTPNEQTELALVPTSWWPNKPYYDKVVYRITGGADIVSLLKSNSVNYVSENLTGQQIDDLKSNGFSVTNEPTPTTLILQMAADSGPTANASIRQALQYAIPYDQIIKTALGGLGTRATSLYNPQDPNGTDNWKVYTYDTAKAKKLLSDAGAKDLSIDFWYSSDYSYNQNIALLIKQAFGEAGVTLNLQPRPGSQLATLASNRALGKPDGLAMTGIYMSQSVIWLDDPSTRTEVSLITTASSNWTRFSDATVDATQTQYGVAPGTQARTDAYKKVQEIMFNAGTFNQIITLGQTVITPKSMSGVTYIPGPYAQWRYLKG